MSRRKENAWRSAIRAAQWWAEMQPNKSANRAALARLRKATVRSAMAEPSIFDLFRRLEFADPCELENVALCAAAIANVRDDDPRHPARVLGPPGPNATEQALLKPIRFRRLIDARDSEDRLTVLRRAIAVGGFRMNVRELAYACFFWTDMTRQDWLFEYYGARTDPTTDSEDSPR